MLRNHLPLAATSMDSVSAGREFRICPTTSISLSRVQSQLVLSGQREYVNTFINSNALGEKQVIARQFAYPLLAASRSLSGVALIHSRPSRVVWLLAVFLRIASLPRLGLPPCPWRECSFPAPLPCAESVGLPTETLADALSLSLLLAARSSEGLRCGSFSFAATRAAVIAPSSSLSVVGVSITNCSKAAFANVKSRQRASVLGKPSRMGNERSNITYQSSPGPEAHSLSRYADVDRHRRPAIVLLHRGDLIKVRGQYCLLKPAGARQCV